MVSTKPEAIHLDNTPGFLRDIEIAAIEKGVEQKGSFDAGIWAFKEGLSEADCPFESDLLLSQYWIKGYRLASKRYAENPPLYTEEYLCIKAAIDQLYTESLKSGVLPKNPYPANTEASDIWEERFQIIESDY